MSDAQKAAARTCVSAHGPQLKSVVQRPMSAASVLVHHWDVESSVKKAVRLRGQAARVNTSAVQVRRRATCSPARPRHGQGRCASSQADHRLPRVRSTCNTVASQQVGSRQCMLRRYLVPVILEASLAPPVPASNPESRRYSYQGCCGRHRKWTHFLLGGSSGASKP